MMREIQEANAELEELRRVQQDGVIVECEDIVCKRHKK